MLRMEIDAWNNRLRLNGLEQAPRAQWLCAFLQVLVESSRRHSRRLTRQDLEHALARFGRPASTPLAAKQMQRLVDGLRSVFVAVGHADAFDARFICQPLGKTTGPWVWSGLPGDETIFIASAAQRSRVAASSSSSSGTNHTMLPALAEAALGQQTAELTALMKQAYAQSWDGHQELAIEVLTSPDAWRLASPELNALRWVKCGDLLVGRRDFEGANRCFDTAQAHLQSKNPLADGVLTPLLMAARLRLHYHRQPVANYQDLLDSAYAAQAPHHPLPGEANPSGHADRLNLLMLCERRWLEAHAQSADAEQWANHLEAMLRCGHAAIFLCLAAQLHERAQNVCANLAYAHQRLAMLDRKAAGGTPMADGQHLQRAIEWHALSLSYRLRFDLPDNSAYEYIFLGEFWLSGAAARAAFEKVALHVAWLGMRPDQASFYTHACACAQLLRDPRQQAYTALNKYRFGRFARNPKVESKGLALLSEVLAAHPDLHKVLVDEGYAVPVKATTFGPR